jgi:membrane fusion protein, multidrug efflux system
MARAFRYAFMKTKTKIWILAIVGLLAVVGALVGIKAGQIGAMIQAGKSFQIPPESVATAQVEASEWEGSQPAIGSLVAVRGVTLSAEFSGTVRAITFDSGAAVRKGDVLVRLDTSIEEAQLEAALADATLARLSLDRAKQLRAEGSNTPADIDAAVARARQTEATVASLKATIDKKTIRAPFDGRISIRQVELGQVIGPGNPIASLVTVSPIHADFWLPQQALVTLALGQKVQVRTDSYPGATWEGKITTVSPEVDPATRNVKVRATLPNADAKLKPGMYVNVEVLSARKRPVLLIPATAVLYAPYGDSVYALEKKTDGGKEATVAKQKFVRLGERRGDYVAVTEGLAPGETVVSAGAFKLRNGMAVVVNNALAPGAQLAPKVADQ